MTLDELSKPAASALFDSITRIARHEASARAVAGVGKVVTVYPAPEGSAEPDHAVTVEMLDTGLVLPRVAVAVGAMGFASIPQVDELVVVVFLEGDFNAPVIVGRLYHEGLNPPPHAENEIVLGLPAGSSSPDLKLVVDGKAPSIKLDLPGEVKVTIEEEKVLLEVGKMRVSLEGAGGGRAEIAAGGSTITLKQDGDISVTAKGKLKLEGSEVEISGQAKVKITGAQVEVN
ncbi:MAG TPA: phage baseplate assembly protein V [Dehalococcoidia bacterium]|nr:phage baseplate assembly protein V [Dehalococcoidia bacterium]